MAGRQRHRGRRPGDRPGVRRSHPSRPRPAPHLGRAGRRQQPPARSGRHRSPGARRGRGDRGRLRARAGVPVAGRLVLLRRGRPCGPDLGARSRPVDPGRTRQRRRCGDPPQGHPQPPGRRQAQARRHRRLLPAQQEALPGLPDRARPWLADRHRRDRGRLPAPGQRPHGPHRRSLGPGRRRGDPQAPGAPQQRRLRRLLGLPPGPRATTGARGTLRQRRHSRPMTTPEKRCTHFIVRGARSGSADGHIWQLMDTGRQADANLNANAFAISIETEDNGDPDDFPWSRAQLASLRWLHAKLRAVHPTIPRRRCPSPRGGGLGYHTMWGAPSAWTPVAGKLLALDTLVPTPDGLLALREIRVGATVFDERGEPCKVTATYDDLPERAWRIMFDDGLEVLAGGEHQWVTITRGQRKGYFRRDRPRDRHRGPRPDSYPQDWARWGKVRNTDEIASGILASDGAYQHTIPVARRLRLGERELPVDPYLLGVWLGDGGERDGVITAGFDPDDLMASDAEFIARQFIRAGYELGVWQPRYGHRTLTLRALGFERQLRELGVLGNKHAPQDYLVAS